MNDEIETKVVWRALEGSQRLFLNSPYRETMLHGSRGSGKTECAVMAWAQNVGIGYGARWTGVIFRRKYHDLDDVIAKSKRLFLDLYGNESAKWFRSGKGDLKWIFPTGEILMFRKFDKIDDYSGFHGQEIPWILWEEVTNWPSDDCYEIMKSCNRSVDVWSNEGLFKPNGRDVNEKGQKKMPLKYLSTTNPSGSGHGWVKSYFIDAGEAYKPIRNEIGEERCHIPSSVFENPYMDKKYVKSLFAIKDENLKKAWLYGSWNIVAGGLFSDVWNEGKNIVKPFEIPHSWKIDRSLDWGSTHPFSVIWYAESDGTDYVDVHGKSISTVRGDLFAILEYYGAAGPNVGLRLTGREVAINIRDCEMNHPLLKGRRVVSGPADTGINGSETGVSIASSMQQMGIYWTKADKSSGSRVLGWEVIRQKLHNAHNGSGLPSLRIFSDNHCKDLLRLIPVAPRDTEKPDDLDTNSEDHNLDSLRYRCRKHKGLTRMRQF